MKNGEATKGYLLSSDACEFISEKFCWNIFELADGFVAGFADEFIDAGIPFICYTEEGKKRYGYHNIIGDKIVDDFGNPITENMRIWAEDDVLLLFSDKYGKILINHILQF